MKFIFILPLTLLSVSICSADSDVEANIPTTTHTRQLTTTQCLEIEPYNKQVSDKEISRVFGSPLQEEVNGPIGMLNCRGGRQCPKIELVSFVPDLPWVGGGVDQRISKGNGRWLLPVTNGSRTCNPDEIVTGVQCKGQDCSRIQIKCSPLNSDLYQRDFSTTFSNGSTSTSFNKNTKCGKNRFMVGVECSGYGCSEIRLVCAGIEFKHKKTNEKCESGVPRNDVPAPTPTSTCQDKTFNDGQPWHDNSNYDCFYYKRWDQCDSYGDMYRNIYTANEACCACGGGNRS